MGWIYALGPAGLGGHAFGSLGHRADKFWATCQEGHAIRAARDSGKAVKGLKRVHSAM